jgi:hypothetical protein
MAEHAPDFVVAGRGGHGVREGFHMNSFFLLPAGLRPCCITFTARGGKDQL